MLWIVQTNLFNENRRQELVHVLSRLNINFLEVNVSNNDLDVEILDNNQPIITNGSIMLSNIANSRNWQPGSLFNENFSYSVWSSQYKNLLLNKNATISSLKNVEFIGEKAFIRPVLDNKSFNGKLFTKSEFLKFQQNSIENNSNFPNPDIEVLISSPKTIGQEHRHYIVDGEIITSSRYKLAGTPNFSEGADQSILDVVNEAISIWQPARAFVLDTYVSGSEIGIVEIGSICHAGLYQCDLMKLVHSLDNMKPSVKSSLKIK